MTTADLVNLITSKLRTGRVEFLTIASWPDLKCVHIKFAYGFRTYSLECDRGVITVFSKGVVCQVDNYSQWIAGVLNGKTRNEEGVLA